MSRYNKPTQDRPKQSRLKLSAKRPSAARRTRHKAPEGTEYLYGQHTVLEALMNPARRVKRLMATENAAKRFSQTLELSAVPAEICTSGQISRLTGPDSVHQGLLIETDVLPEPDLQSVLERPGPIVVLDQITDPHNVGAVIRSCSAFAAAGLVMTARHSPGASAVLAKSASGGLEHVPLVRVTNLSKAIQTMKDNGVICVGLDSEASETLETCVQGAERVALVLGAEGKGLRQKTRENCSHLASISMPGAIRSLNVSNAAALALYVADRAVRLQD